MTDLFVAQIQHRRDTAANWTAANPKLADGEWGYEKDTGKYKIGDGVLLWVSLPYSNTQTISDYIKLDPMGCIVPETNPAAIDYDETTTNKNNYTYGKFTQAGDGVNRLQWREILKEDWLPTGTISLKVHWTVKTGTAGHKMKWELLCKQLADGESLDTALVSLGTVEDAIIGNEYLHISTAVTPAAISGAAGSEVIFELRRIASAATETASDGRFLGGSVKYTRTLA